MCKGFSTFLKKSAGFHEDFRARIARQGRAGLQRSRDGLLHVVLVQTGDAPRRVTRVRINHLQQLPV